jgi:hypothetical protein
MMPFPAKLIASAGPAGPRAGIPAGAAREPLQTGCRRVLEKQTAGVEPGNHSIVIGSVHMAKIGRNDPCPCGSGKKFKKCCYLKQKESGNLTAPPQVSLRAEVAKIQEAAVRKEAKIVHLGVFVLFATEAGDGWLLELTDMDGVLVADRGEKIDIEMEENPETIEVNWSHRFTISDKKFVATSYKDEAVTVHEDYPTHSIQAAIRKIRKKFSPELLKNIHLSQERAAEA